MKKHFYFIPVWQVMYMFLSRLNKQSSSKDNKKQLLRIGKILIYEFLMLYKNHSLQ